MRVGLVYDRFGDRPPPPGAPPDWDAEYEPEATVAALEGAVRRLGHAPVRVGNAEALLVRMAEGPLGLGSLPDIDLVPQIVLQSHAAASLLNSRIGETAKARHVAKTFGDA